MSLLGAAALLATACAPDPELAPDDEADDQAGGADTSVVTVDEKLDAATTEPRAHIDGFTVWVDPVAVPITRDGRRLWVLNGRTSKNLSDVFTFVPDDPYGTARVLSPRKFEIAFDAGSEINTMMSGLPIFVRLVPTTGETVFASVWFGPRFARFTGSSKVYMTTKVKPVWVAGELVYRGHASTSAPYEQLSAANAEGAAPAVVLESARHWKLDWTFDQMVKVADPPTDTLVLTGRSVAGATVTKNAGVDFAVAQLGLTKGDPYEVWASSCEPDVHACLAALPAGQLDTDACGTYRQVQWCGGAPMTAEPSGATLVANLQGYLAYWYQAREAEVVAHGGSSLAAAQAAVAAAKFERVTDPAGDPHGHDLAEYWVYRHPDVVWPGSDIVWFSVYDRLTGNLVETFDFN